MQCPVFVLATDEGHSAVTETFGKNKKEEMYFQLQYMYWQTTKTKSMLQNLVVVAYTCVHTFIEVVDVEFIGPPQRGGFVAIGFLDE